MHSVSFWITETGLIVLMLLSTALLFSGSKDFVPRDPSLLGGLATVIACSGEFQAACKGAASCSEENLKASLRSSQFSTAVTPEQSPRSNRFSIKWHVSGGSQPGPSALKPSAESWWHPTGTSWIYITAISLLTLVTIGMLEGLYQYAKRHDGLVQLENTASNVHFAWTTLPAVFTIAMAALFGMQTFATYTLQPFQRLKIGNASARSGLFTHPFTGGEILSLIEAFRDREFAVLVSTTAVLLASFLTIAVSGLFDQQLNTSFKSVRVQQTDWFDHNVTGINQAAMRIGLVTLGNLSYPRFTHDTLAFPKLNRINGPTTGKVNLRVPAIQGVMNCSLLPSEDVVTVNNTWSDDGWTDQALVALRNNTCLSKLVFDYPFRTDPLCKGGPYGAGPHDVGTLYDKQIKGYTAPGGWCATDTPGNLCTLDYTNTIDPDTRGHYEGYPQSYNYQPTAILGMSGAEGTKQSVPL